ncbi:MAG: homogentisate 1,2-dioxygenase [Myxococcales bacterium]|nr:homogentisate 1,2-dioxygenase [Myxococcales bacterium]MCB9642755.1 homogentisate 1,2-dioxygenase [Myxococcales bacterium]
MPHYYQLGEIPKKRHTQFRRPDGKLYSEELVSTEGFSNLSSLVYHVHPPTAIKEAGTPYSVAPKVALEKNIIHRSFLGFRQPTDDDFLKSRRIVFTNNDLNVALAAPRHGTNYFYKNAQSDEVIFIHEGEGTLRTMLGNLDFSYGDYLVIPRGTIYQIDFKSEDNRLFIVESHSPISFPHRYRNEFGQLLEHSPFCERDIRKPEVLETHDEKGDFKVLIKKQDTIYPLYYAYHPFDVIGWDGYFFPYAFSIHDFEPITGRVHQPPPVHQTFAARGFVICSFVPRLYDYHPEAIPAPYNHSNIDSDEVLYYVDGDFMSRKHVERGMITLHPMGIPHGPHPGAVERSIGKKETQELAVMVDTFAPLKITEEAVKLEDPLYHKSWIEE